MKLKDGYMLRCVAGKYIVVAVGDASVDFNGIITTNETGAFLWKLLENETTENDLINSLISEYDVDPETANKDVSAFVKNLKDAELLLNE